MTRHRTILLLAALGACMAFGPAAGWARPEAQARLAEGRRNAIEDCSACHRVTAGQRQPAPVPNSDEAISVQAPAFDRIARRYAGRTGALREVIQAPRHPMREQQFLPEELDSLIRYIGSLQKERW